MSQSAARKKTISYSKHKIIILIANVFQESKMFHQTMFFRSNLNILHPGDIFVFGTSCYFVIYQQFLRNHCRSVQLTSQPLVKNLNNIYVFLPASFTVTDLSGNTGFLLQVQKVTSVGCNCFKIMTRYTCGFFPCILAIIPATRYTCVFLSRILAFYSQVYDHFLTNAHIYAHKKAHIYALQTSMWYMGSQKVVV